jgi:hypothetical protein
MIETGGLDVLHHRRQGLSISEIFGLLSQHEKRQAMDL